MSIHVVANAKILSFKNYLFIYLVVFSLSCHKQVLCCIMQDLFVAVYRLSSCGVWAH